MPDLKSFRAALGAKLEEYYPDQKKTKAEKKAERKEAKLAAKAERAAKVAANEAAAKAEAAKTEAAKEAALRERVLPETAGSTNNPSAVDTASSEKKENEKADDTKKSTAVPNCEISLAVNNDGKPLKLIPVRRGRPIVIQPHTYDLVTNLSLFAILKPEEFKTFSKEALIAYIYLYAPDQLPERFEEVDHETIFNIFYQTVYPNKYWPAWVREALRFCMLPPHCYNFKAVDVLNISKMADDYDFLEALAPWFKEKAIAAYNRRIEAMKNGPNAANGNILSLGLNMPKQSTLQAETQRKDLGEGTSKKKLKKKKTEQNAGGGGKPIITTKEIAAVFPQLPHLLKVESFDELMDLFLLASHWVPPDTHVLKKST
ncbi:hypothetical protein AA313_de0207888 [Arthrobotrys entomopaga]|nr:hypothetical protein AA313_de0207888 [Arthrobotrys entomopaga]